MRRIDVETFFINKKGYLKKSPIEAAKAIWKSENKHKTEQQLAKDIKLIAEVQKKMRTAKAIQEDLEDDKFTKIYAAIKEKPKKRLFFDIETSPNIVFSWNVGRKISIDSGSIINERAIICIGYKWEGESTTHCLSWNKGDDKALLKKFIQIMEQADEVVTHNGDSFDIKWLRGRALFHGLPMSPKFNSIDTLKLARTFRLNSNKLNYIAQYLNIGKKIETNFGLWKSILLDNDNAALQKMMTYCKQDVILLEEVFHKLKTYVPEKRFRYKV